MTLCMSYGLLGLSGTIAWSEGSRRSAGHPSGRTAVVDVVARDEREELAHHREGLGLRFTLEVRDAASRVVGVGTAELLVRDLLVRDRPDESGPVMNM